MPTLQTFIARLPKVELHLHLEGSLRSETLRELCRGRGWLERRVADWIAERQSDRYGYGSLTKFITAFAAVTLLLETPQDYALAATRLVEWLAEQNVRYAEVTLSAGVVLWKRQSLAPVYEAAASAAQEAARRCGVRVQWIFDAIRQFGPAHAREVLEWAIRFRPQGVVAFGIGGDEERGPARLFADVFRAARDAGLRLTAHAGESAGPESIRDAVELLGAERIGHGTSAAGSPEVMALLRERAIPLELCPTSNVATGSIARFEEHPLPKFLEAGLAVTLNSDDPAMFGTSLEGEFQRAAQAFSLAPAILVGLCENAVRAAFLTEGEKQPLLDELHALAPA